MNIIPIAFSSDNNFANQMGVTILSLLKHAKTDTFYKIYAIVDDSFTKENEKLILSLKNKNCEIKLLKIENVFKDAFEIRGITTATYFRLLLPSLLKEENKIIYSDVDIIFQDDLWEVYQTNLDNDLLAAVKSLQVPFNRIEKEFKNWKKYLSNSKKTYFQAGFLLMNLDKMRKENIEEKWNKLSKEKFYAVDQDILNITCKNKVVFLPYKYNAVTNYTKRAKFNTDLFTKQEMNESPVVLHFAGKKPWNDENTKDGDKWWEVAKENKIIYNYFLNRPFIKKNNFYKVKYFFREYFLEEYYYVLKFYNYIKKKLKTKEK